MSSVKAEPIKTLKSIIIIFDSIKSNYDTLTFKNGTDAIIPGATLSIQLSPLLTVTPSLKDTIKIQPKLDYIVVSHKYSPTSSVKFILQSGDIVHIKYINGLPLVQITNRKEKMYDVNYDYYKRLRYPCIEEMQSIDILNYPHILAAKRIFKGEKSTSLKVIEEFQPVLFNELKNENLWLDSIYQSALISAKEYHFYKDRNKYISLNQALKTKSTEELISVLKTYKDSLYINDVPGFYRNYYYAMGLKYLNSIIPTIKGNKQIGVYNHIENSKFINGKLSQDLKLKGLIEIINTSPAEVRREYFKKFSASVVDTALVSNLYEHFRNLLDPNVTNSLDLELLDANGVKTNLSSIMKKFVGKIVYIDFWASWCAPCIKEMPDSKKLRDNPLYKNTVFLYLALNDTKDQWKLAWKKANLENYLYNYLILNSKDASFIKQNKINTIPRYMLFDRKGKLMNGDAPRPSDTNIHNVLNLY